MTNTKNSTKYIVLILLTLSIVVINNTSIVELALSKFLLTLDSFEHLYLIVLNEMFSKLFVVRLVSAFSDSVISFSKVYQVISLKDIIVFLLYILILDINKNYLNNNPHLKLSIRLYYVFMFLKYLSLVIILLLALFKKLSYILAVNIYGFILLIVSILFIINGLYTFYSAYNIIKKGWYYVRTL